MITSNEPTVPARPKYFVKTYTSPAVVRVATMRQEIAFTMLLVGFSCILKNDEYKSNKECES